MKVLVTGGAGFIGSHVVDKLIKENFQVVVIDNLSTGKEENLHKLAKFYRVDIRDEALQQIFNAEKPDFVIHHAAQIDVQTSQKNPMLDAQVNILGTLNLVKQSTNFQVKKFIYASSAAVYGNPQYLGVDEVHPINPVSCYGISKYSSENYVRVFSQLTGLKYTIFRYANVYGPRQAVKGEGGVVAIFLDNIKNKQAPIIFGDGEQTRDFVHVKDVAAANLLALTAGDNQIFNIGCNTQISVNSLFAIIAQTLGTNINPIYQSHRAGDIIHNYLENSKAKAQLFWKPEYDLVSGIRVTLDYYLNSGNVC